MIYVDTIYMIGKNGIARDSQNLLEELAISNDVIEIHFLGLLLNKNRVIRRILNTLNLLLGLHIPISRKHRGVFYQPHVSFFRPGKNTTGWIIRLHDIFPMTNPEWFNWWANAIFKRNLEYAAKNGAFFLFSSKQSQSVFLSRFPECKERVALIPCIPKKSDHDLCHNCEGCLEIAHLPNQGNTLLAVGTIEPRKNYDLLISLWKLYGSELPNICQLLVIGGPGWKSKRIQHKLSQLAPQNLKWIKNCCDGALRYFYENSYCFVSASIDEGFNLPALEARALYRLPLFLSDVSVHREVHGEEATYFKSCIELYNLLSSNLEMPKKSIPYVTNPDISILDDLLNRFG